METARLLQQLTEARGPSGYESEVREIVRTLLGAHAHEMRVDSLGNLIALRRGSGPAGAARPSLMLAGHMDEIALVVLQIEKGFLRIGQVGGFDPRVLFGQEVVVHGVRELPGLVVSVPPHFTEPAEREKPVPLDQLFVDLGLAPAEVESLVHVGDLITQRGRWTTLAGGYAANKCMDDRTAVATMALCMEELAGREHAWDVYAVATVQEETGLKGATTAAWGLTPTAAIAIDATFGAQPGLSPTETVKMDGGPTIALGPNFHPRIFDRLMAAAGAREIPVQVEPLPGASGTDAWAIQVSHSGVPCGLVSIPVRSMHTPVETVCLRDIERAAHLLAEFICRLDVKFADTLVTRDALAVEREPREEA
jgi:tetrahedral aminopeptidase